MRKVKASAGRRRKRFLEGLGKFVSRRRNLMYIYIYIIAATSGPGTLDSNPRSWMLGDTWLSRGPFHVVWSLLLCVFLMNQNKVYCIKLYTCIWRLYRMLDRKNKNNSNHIHFVLDFIDAQPWSHHLQNWASWKHWAHRTSSKGWLAKVSAWPRGRQLISVKKVPPKGSKPLEMVWCFCENVFSGPIWGAVQIAILGGMAAWFWMFIPLGHSMCLCLPNSPTRNWSHYCIKAPVSGYDKLTPLKLNLCHT